MSAGPEVIEAKPEGANVRVAVIVSRYNDWITDRLLEGAVEEYTRLGGEPSRLVVVRAPGAWELAALAGAAARTGRFDAVVALGCLIRGETNHDRVIGGAVSGALARLSAEANVAIGFGLLTVDNADQGEARAGGEMGNKGAEAMRAAVETACAARALFRAGGR